jgi:hypothetical protein
VTHNWFFLYTYSTRTAHTNWSVGVCPALGSLYLYRGRDSCLRVLTDLLILLHLLCQYFPLISFAMKPISASEVLRNRNFSQANPFEVLWNRTDSGSVIVDKSRDRVNSFKRKASNDINSDLGKKQNAAPDPVPAPIKHPSGGGPPSVDCQKLASMGRKIDMMRGICGKLNEDAAKIKVDIGLESIIRSFCEFVDVSASMHEDFLTLCKVEIPMQVPEDSVFVDNANLPPVANGSLTEGSSQPQYSQVAAKKNSAEAGSGSGSTKFCHQT